VACNIWHAKKLTCVWWREGESDGERERAFEKEKREEESVRKKREREKESLRKKEKGFCV